MKSHFLFLRKLESSVWYYLGAVFLLLIALMFLIWLGARDNLLKAVFGEPVFYFHAKLNSQSRQYFAPVFKNIGIDLPKKLREFSVVSFAENIEDDGVTKTFIISRKKINDSSQKIAKLFWTAVASQAAIEASSILQIGNSNLKNAPNIKKPSVWFSAANYGLISPKAAADFLPAASSGLFDNGKPIYFKASFSDQQINLSFLPSDWRLSELIKPRRFGFKKLYLPNLSQVPIQSSQIFLSQDSSSLRAILEIRLGQSLNSYPELMQNKDWAILGDWLAEAQNFLYVDESKGQWFVSWQSSKPVPLAALESGSRSFLAEVWPVLIKRNLADGTEFTEIVADPGVYQWTQIDPSFFNIYRLNRVVASNFIYFGFADKNLWLSNNEKMAKEAGQVQFFNISRLIPWLRQRSPCKTSLNKAKQFFYSGFPISLGNLFSSSALLAVDKGYGVDICIHRNVDK